MKLPKTNIIFFVILLVTSCGPDSAQVSKSASITPDGAYPKQVKPLGSGATYFDSLRLKMQAIPALGISMAIPEGWVLTHRTKQGQDVWLVKSPCESSTKFCANYVLNSTPRQKEVSVKNYGDSFITRLRNKYDTFTLINRDEQIINGIPSCTFDYIQLEKGLDLGSSTTLYFLDEKLIIVNFGAMNEPKGDYVRYRGLYTRILASIKPLKN